jgi:hypothetical protein
MPQKVSSANLKFVPSTGTLTANYFVGDGSSLTGTAASLTVGNANKVAIVEDTSTNSSFFPTFVTSTNGFFSQKVSTTNLSFVPQTGTLTATKFVGDGSSLTGITASTNANLTGAITSTGNSTSLGTFSSANLSGALSDETGTGAAVMANSPALVTPNLGIPTVLVGTNITGTATGLTAGNATNAAYTTITDSFDNFTCYPTYVTGNAGNLPQKVSSTKLSFVPSTGTLTADKFVGDGSSLTGITSTNFTGALGGDVTGTQGVTKVEKINGTSLALLNTGILKNTAGTGIPSIAVAADFPTLNQSTTGNAATATIATHIAGGLTGSIPYQIAVNTTGFLPIGTDGQILTLSSGYPSWQNVNLASVGTIGSTPNASGASLISGILNLQPADGSNGGVISTSAQTIAGVKTFSSNAIVNGLTIGKGNNNIASNTAFGVSALDSNTYAINNTAVGNTALIANTSGSHNTAIGSQSLSSNISGDFNTAIGLSSLNKNTVAHRNTAIGAQSLTNNTIGVDNTAVGYLSLSSNTTGRFNTALGSFALAASNSNDGNTAIGFSSLKVSTGVGNTVVGSEAMQAHSTGGYNVAIGYGASDRITSGTGNTVLGYAAGRWIGSGADNTTMDSSTLIGYEAKPNNINETNQIVIGYNAKGNGSNTVQIGNTSITNLKTSGTITAGAVTYPNSSGSSGQILTTNGNGTASWSNPTVSGVPYIGATASVNLGSNDLTAANIAAKTYTITQPNAITAATTTFLDFAAGNLMQVNLGMNITAISISNAKVGTYMIKFKQDSTGFKTVVFPAEWKWSGGLAPTITSTADKTDIVTVIYDGSTYYATIAQNF